METLNNEELTRQVENLTEALEYTTEALQHVIAAGRLMGAELSKLREQVNGTEA